MKRVYRLANMPLGVLEVLPLLAMSEFWRQLGVIRVDRYPSDFLMPVSSDERFVSVTIHPGFLFSQADK